MFFKLLILFCSMPLLHAKGTQEIRQGHFPKTPQMSFPCSEMPSARSFSKPTGPAFDPWACTSFPDMKNDNIVHSPQGLPPSDVDDLYKAPPSLQYSTPNLPIQGSFERYDDLCENAGASSYPSSGHFLSSWDVRRPLSHTEQMHGKSICGESKVAFSCVSKRFDDFEPTEPSLGFDHTSNLLPMHAAPPTVPTHTAQREVVSSSHFEQSARACANSAPARPRPFMEQEDAMRHGPYTIAWDQGVPYNPTGDGRYIKGRPFKKKGAVQAEKKSFLQPQAKPSQAKPWNMWG